MICDENTEISSFKRLTLEISIKFGPFVAPAAQMIYSGCNVVQLFEKCEFLNYDLTVLEEFYSYGSKYCNGVKFIYAEMAWRSEILQLS